jgi:hypothetical protein
MAPGAAAVEADDAEMRFRRRFAQYLAGKG